MLLSCQEVASARARQATVGGGGLRISVYRGCASLRPTALTPLLLARTDASARACTALLPQPDFAALFLTVPSMKLKVLVAPSSFNLGTEKLYPPFPYTFFC